MLVEEEVLVIPSLVGLRDLVAVVWVLLAVVMTL
jgi:hypothetical protein